ncbi:MAG: peptidyl-prolyl cis-trans isomerase [Tannerellaceae bacterium]|nr:peptidyl-prolyl cis-trans isomerase [Tannerellaceae bacterium]
MRTSFIFFIFLFLYCSCRNTRTVDNTDIIVSVKDRVLYRTEISSLIPRGTSSTDSLLLAENYVKKWIKDALVYNVALRNLGNEKEEIEKLVDDYRYSLYRYRYQEKLIWERLSANIRESDKLNYYDENQDKFVLDKSLIKGLFLKIPVDAPSLSDVKNWYKSSSAESLEKIEKYSIQNATIYDYFYDRWIDFDEVMSNIPVRISNTSQFLKNNKTVEVTDSSFCYLLNIKEYIPVGKVAPYEYAEAQIIEMLINQRKMEFLRNFENELYNDAIKGGDVVFGKESQEINNE